MDTKKKLTRFEEREQSFLLVFEKIFNPQPLDEVIACAKESRDLEFCDYAFEVTNGVYNVKDDIDAHISNHLKAPSH